LDLKKTNAPNAAVGDVKKLNALGTSITSDRVEVSFNGDQTELSFRGNVKVNSSEFSENALLLKSQPLGNLGAFFPLLNALLESIKQISITGPLILNYGERSCSADYAEITTANSTAILSGNAMAKDTMGTISGGEIRINYKTKSIEILSASENKPVTVNVSENPFDGEGMSLKQ
jgi:lipopolysaccharide export system protein LptA